MEIVLFLAGCIALGYALWSFTAAIWRGGRRKWQLKKGGMAFACVIGCMIGIMHVQEQSAIKEGFAGTSDKQAAKKAGITDAAAWLSHKQVLAEEAKKAADALAKARAEKAAAEAIERAAKEKEEARIAEEQRLEDERQETARKEQEERLAQEKKAACLKDVTCFFRENEIELSVACTLAVQSLAKWDYQWTDSWSEPKFVSAGWGDPDKGTLMAMGKTLKLQNGFGAWKRVQYICEYNPTTKSVVGARVF